MRSALNAGQSRKYDVYAGLDVFGRGCYKGGGFKTREVSFVSKKMM